MTYPTQKEIKDQESAGWQDYNQRKEFGSSNSSTERYDVLDMAYRRGWDSAKPKRIERGFHNPGF